jgi:hypothetical protein
VRIGTAIFGARETMSRPIGRAQTWRNGGVRGELGTDSPSAADLSFPPCL